MTLTATAPPYLYTSRKEMESIYSIDGVTNRQDDDEDDRLNTREVSNMDDLIWEATDWVNLYLCSLYAASALYTSPLVRRWATYYAVNELTKRTGNKGQYQKKVDDYQAIMERILAGDLYIPRLPIRQNSEPALSNLVVDLRTGQSAIRVVGPSSTSDPNTVDNPDIFPPGSPYGSPFSQW